jgi:hypothetical protein
MPIDPSDKRQAAVTGRIAEQIIDLDTALSEIDQACEKTNPADVYRSPFFLIVGAGVSYPSVPLAPGIIHQCREIADKYGRSRKPSGPKALDEYSHWFKLAYPNPGQRQLYLRSLIEKKPLSSASLRLAHLLSSRRLTNLVVTTNFDDFIARALRLFGEEPAICDHPSTVARIDPQRQDIQIIHVHGSYLFYDCANLRGEVAGRAKHDEESSLTMIGLLDNILWTRSPLVLGYSGWDQDVIMSALHRRLRGSNPLAQSVYWFCFRRDEVMKLPKWLHSDPNVRFVLPKPKEAAEDAAAREPAVPGSFRDLTQSPLKDKPPASPVPDEPTLSALEVLDRINVKLKIGLPRLFENPLGYFAASLEASLPEEEAQNPVGSLYAFKALIEEIRNAEKQAQKRSERQKVRETDQLLDDLRIFKMQSQYEDVVKVIGKLVPDRLSQLSRDSRQEVLEASDLAAKRLLKKKVSEAIKAPLAAALSVSAEREKGLEAVLARNVVTVKPFHVEAGYSFEHNIQGKTYGLMTYHLAHALNDPASDLNRDGRISLHEAVIAAASKILFTDLSGSAPGVLGYADRLFLFAAQPAAKSDRSGGRLLSVLFGVGKYKMGASSALQGPPNDIELLKHVLSDPKRLLLREAVVKTFKDRQATVAQARHGLEWLVKTATANDIVLFYFSGHSSYMLDEKNEKQAIHVFYDYDTAQGFLFSREIHETLAQSQAAFKIVITD